jgi:pimeloyl-ACP methyl ester carboxylesterase
MPESIKASQLVSDVHLVTLDGVRLRARWRPGPGRMDSGPLYLLGHGFTGSSAEPRVVAIAERLVTFGSGVLALDFRGHGQSSGRASVGVAEIADVAAGVAWLRARHPGRAVVVLGFSMGASVVVRHAGLGGDADAVIAVSGPGRWFVRSTEPMRRLNRGLETRIGRVVLRRLLKTRVDRGWDSLPAAPVEVAGGIAVPLLVVHGDADSYFSLEHPRMLASAAPGAELWIEPGMGHAESATSRDLVDRMYAWALEATAGSASMAR